MAIGKDRRRVQAVLDVPLYESVELAAKRCGVSVSRLVYMIVRESQPSTITGTHWEFGKGSSRLLLLRGEAASTEKKSTAKKSKGK